MKPFSIVEVDSRAGVVRPAHSTRRAGRPRRYRFDRTGTGARFFAVSRFATAGAAFGFAVATAVLPVAAS